MVAFLCEKSFLIIPKFISGQEAKEAAGRNSVTFGQQRLSLGQVFCGSAFKEAQDGEGGRLVGFRQRRGRVQLAAQRRRRLGRRTVQRRGRQFRQRRHRRQRRLEGTDSARIAARRLSR